MIQLWQSFSCVVTQPSAKELGAFPLPPPSDKHTRTPAAVALLCFFRCAGQIAVVEEGICSFLLWRLETFFPQSNHVKH